MPLPCRVGGRPAITLCDLKAIRDLGDLLSELSDDDLCLLAPELEVEQHSAGDVLIAIGDVPEKLFIVVEGRLTIESPGEGPAPGFREERGSGDLVGAVAFSEGGAQRHAVSCLEDCRLLTLSRGRLDRLLETSPEGWRAIERAVLARVRLHHATELLDHLFGPFGALLPHVIRELESELEWRTFKSGETLYREGDRAEAAFILLSGRLIAVSELPNGEEEFLYTTLPGETVGEVGLLTRRPHPFTVFAARDSEVIRLSRRSFELMLERNSRALTRVSRIIASRLARRRFELDRQQAQISCIALLPASEEVMLEGLVEVLRRGLSAYGEVVVLSSDSAERELGMPGIAQVSDDAPAHLRLLQWLQEKERDGRLLVYQADPTWTKWSERCASQADHLTIVAEAGSAPNLEDLEDLEQRLVRPRRRWSLLLLHPPETDRPRGTASWLDRSHADAVYHARRGNQADEARLIRLLAGRGVGLVLGGGGARGFAQVGVIRAMEELGIPIDMVGGTSIGAVMAYYAARRMDPSEIQGHLRSKWSALLDYTFPAVSLMTGRRITNLIDNESAGINIEDLWLPYFAVATNLTSSESVVHTRGKVADAIRASVSIPGVLPPVSRAGDLLVDGGVLNNMPIDVMRERNPYGTVIAIDVAPPRGPEAKVDHGNAISGWSVLLKKILPWTRAPALPGLASTMLTTMVVGSSRARNAMLDADLADLYLNLHVHGVGILEFDVVDETVELGYRDSVEVLREWLNSHPIAGGTS